MDFTLALKFFAFLVGIVAIFVGLLALLKPDFMSEGYGIKTNDKNALAYVRGLGVRDVFIGLSVLTLYVFNEWKILAYISFFIALVAALDFWIVFKTGNKQSSFTHLIGFLISLIYGLFLLYYF